MAKAVFEDLSKRVQDDPSLVKTIKGVYLFTITGKNGEEIVYTVDLKNGNGSVKEGKPEKSDCTITMKEEDFILLMTGKLNGQQAFTQGKLKMKGNMALAMKLGKLTDQAVKAKL